MKVLITTMAITSLIGLIAAGTLPAADFDGDSRDDIAIFRPSSGLWAVRDVTRVYFGDSTDEPVAGDFSGDGIADIGIFRESSGLWAIQNVTRVYFGGASDEPVSGGAGGQRLYDYVVKPGDGADLVAALENTTYRSVFIPDGTYSVSEVINVPSNIKHIVGESNSAIIQFAADGDYLSVDGSNCHLEELRFTGGGSTSPIRGTVYIDNSYTTIENCRSVDSLTSGFYYTGNSDYISFVNCVARNSDDYGFVGVTSFRSSRLTNCSAYNCAGGFVSCVNLSSCYVDGNETSLTGFLSCYNLSACTAEDATTAGFALCFYLSACTADGMGRMTNGFSSCENLSSCHVEDTTSTEYKSCLNESNSND